MTRREINIIMLLFTISLAGLLVTQFFWIRSAFRAADETFRQMNATALRSVLQQSNKFIQYHHTARYGERVSTDRSLTADSIISACTFDALMRHEFHQYRIHDEYEFGIADHLTGRLYLSSATKDKANLILLSPYQKNLHSALDTDRFSVVVWFANEKMIMLHRQNSWLLLLSLLLFTGIVAGYFLSVIKLLSQKRMALIQRDFINNTTHEFKTPLATISIAAEMILSHRKQMPDSQLEKYAAIILDENRRMQHQVDQVLQASLLEEDNTRFAMKPVDLDKILDHCVETGRLMLRNTGGRIDLQGKCGTPVVADQIHITNVINNLIENGIKYSTQEPSLHISIETSGKGVFLRFRDHGIGIASDQFQKIFDRMYRVPAGDLYRTPGTGIGLYYVKKVVESHKGTINVDSKLGEGSLFTLFLPYHQNE